jgi:hypothetical protein
LQKRDAALAKENIFCGTKNAFDSTAIGCISSSCKNYGSTFASPFLHSQYVLSHYLQLIPSGQIRLGIPALKLTGSKYRVLGVQQIAGSLRMNVIPMDKNLNSGFVIFTRKDNLN